MDINFNILGDKLCESESDLARSMLFHYLKDEEFYKDIDSFFTDFNQKNNSKISFIDIQAVYDGEIFDDKKVKLLKKALQEFSEKSEIKLKFNNGEELIFAMTKSGIKDVIDKNTDHIEKISDLEYMNINVLLLLFVKSIQEKLDNILESRNLVIVPEKEKTNILDEDEVGFISEVIASKEEADSEEKLDYFQARFVNVKSRDEAIDTVLNFSQEEKKEFFDNLYNLIVKKGLSNKTKKVSALVDYLGGDNVNSVYQTFNKLYNKPNYSFRKRFLEGIYDNIVNIITPNTEADNVVEENSNEEEPVKIKETVIVQELDENFERKNDLKGFIDFINPIISRLLGKSNILLSGGHFPNDVRIVEEGMFELLDNTTLKSVYFKEIFSVISLEDLNFFIELFLNGKDQCSDEDILKILPGSLKVKIKEEVGEKKVIENRKEKVPDDFFWQGKTYYRTQYPFKKFPDDKKWIKFISDVESTTDLSSDTILNVIVGSMSTKRIGSTPNNSQKGGFRKLKN